MWRKIADEIFSRYIFVIDLIIIIVFAAFLAAAIDQSISGRIDGVILKYREAESSLSTKKVKKYRKYKMPSKGSDFEIVNGKAILARNFFDSVTGPLDEQEYVMEDFSQDDFYGQTADDMSSFPPRCSVQIKVVGLFASDDPDWAFAAVEANNKTQVVHVGETIQDHKVNDISWKYLFLGQGGSSTSCYLDIWQEEIPGVKKAPAAGKVSAGPPKAENIFEKKKTFQHLLNSSISDVSPTEKNIDRELVDYIMQNKQMLMQSGRVLPNIENEEINGFKVYGIRKTSLWGKLGVLNGDIIKSVNGVAFTGPDSVLQAFGSLQDSDHLIFNVTRRGKGVNLDFNIK